MPHVLQARDRPWRTSRPPSRRTCAPALPDLSEAITLAIAESIPEYKRPIEGAFGRALREGVAEVLERFVRLIENPSHRIEDTRVYRALGRGEMRAGRSLDSLQAAYRLGARLAWRHLAVAAAAAELPAEALPMLAEAIFAYIDELAAQSVEGYAEAQSAAAGEHSRRRTPAARAPARPRRRRPRPRRDGRRPRVVGAAPRSRGGRADPSGRTPTRSRGASAPACWRAASAASRACSSPIHGPGRAERLDVALAGRRAAIGPAVEPLAAMRLAAPGPAPARPARRARGRTAARRPSPRRPRARRRPRAAGRARRPPPRPLDAAAPAARARLTETLLAWLELQGSAPAVARQLHVHPQTVRYRLAQLREALGDALEDPQARFELLLVLRAERLHAPS